MQTSYDMQQMVGHTITKVTGLDQHSEEVVFTLQDNIFANFYHVQDCCESVWLEDYEFSGTNIIGAKVLSVEEVVDHNEDEYGNSTTWTFYKINTSQGELFMRWCGESNGYYSESVNFVVQCGYEMLQQVMSSRLRSLYNKYRNAHIELESRMRGLTVQDKQLLMAELRAYEENRNSVEAVRDKFEQVTLNKETLPHATELLETVFTDGLPEDVVKLLECLGK